MPKQYMQLRITKAQYFSSCNFYFRYFLKRIFFKFSTFFSTFFSAILDFTVTNARSQVIDFANAYTMVYISLFIKNPSDAMNVRAYIDPFTGNTWTIILIFFIFLGVFLYFWHRYAKIETH